MISANEMVYRAKGLTPTERRERIANITEEIRKLTNSITVIVSDAKDDDGFERRIASMQATIDKIQKQIDDARNRRENAKELIEATTEQIKDLSAERAILQNVEDISRVLDLQERLNELGVSNTELEPAGN